jgi:hypothetical protein
VEAVKTEELEATAPPATRGPLLVLVHIPKTAGTSLASILHHHYRDGFRGGAGTPPDTPAARMPPNVLSRPDEVESQLRSLEGVRALAAHITFGLADRLPGDARYVTILRDPVERTLSHYFYLVAPPSKAGSTVAAGLGLVPPWLPAPSPELTLDECLTERGYIPDNLQTRMLCGLASPYEPLPADALERAKRNLRERFAFVGTTERFDELLALMNLQLGWPTVAYKRARSNPTRPAVDADLVRIAGERNALDRELHAYADELLDDALAQAASDELAIEIEVLRQAGRAREGGEDVRSLPLEARVQLALKEGELAEEELRNRRQRRKPEAPERRRGVMSRLRRAQ